MMKVRCERSRLPLVPQWPGPAILKLGPTATFAGTTIASADANTCYGTPRFLFDLLDAEFRFTADVAANADNHKMEPWFGPGSLWREDALSEGRWAAPSDAVFCNPPYGRNTPQFTERAREEARAGLTVVLLVPARTETRWWQLHCAGSEVRLVRGRLIFEGARNQAPFPSAIVIMRPGDPAPDAGPWQTVCPTPRPSGGGGGQVRAASAIWESSKLASASSNLSSLL
jgi:site-specific DNA-methyltransferase (adenine-specific)